MIPKRIREGVRSVGFSAEQAEVAQRQIEPIIAYHLCKFTVHRDIDEQLRAVAFDAYMQGLLDGWQVSAAMKESAK